MLKYVQCFHQKAESRGQGPGVTTWDYLMYQASWQAYLLHHSLLFLSNSVTHVRIHSTTIAEAKKQFS